MASAEPITLIPDESGGVEDAAFEEPSGRYLGGRFSVQIEAPLAHLDTPGATAYAAQSLAEPGRTVYALVHNPHIPHRQHVAESLVANPISCMTGPLAQEVVVIPTPAGEQERLVSFIELPKGKPLFKGNAAAVPMTRELLTDNIIPALIYGLVTLHDRGLTHRAIRPDNIYLALDDPRSATLGDGFSAPAGATYDPVYETLDRCFAETHARGEGEPADDLYALGVTVLALVLGRSPGADKSAKELLEARVAQGSFRAAMGNAKLPHALHKLVRGLMADDPRQRWQMSDVLTWIDGHEADSRPGLAHWALSQPTRFAGVRHHDRRLLADALACNADLAFEFFSDKNTITWLRSLIGGDVVGERIEKLLTAGLFGSQRLGTRARHMELAKICQILHPSGPFRYYGWSIASDGLGPAVARVFHGQDRTQLARLHELMSERLIGKLAEIATAGNPGAGGIGKSIQAVARLAGRSTLGFGLERALYQLNPRLSCLSQKFAGKVVDTEVRLLTALDQVSEAGAKEGLMDRHIAAFCASRLKQSEPLIRRLDSDGSGAGKTALALLELFARLQQKAKVEALPHLASALAAEIKPLARSLRFKNRREQFLAALDKAAKSGDLARMHAALDFAKAESKDREEFSRAAQLFAVIEAERKKLGRGLDPHNAQAARRGQQIAAGLATLVLFATIIYVMKGL